MAVSPFNGLRIRTVPASAIYYKKLNVLYTDAWTSVARVSIKMSRIEKSWKTSYPHLMTVDGSPLSIVGEVFLVVFRHDDAVELPEVSFLFLVVPSTDVILGNDLIGVAGDVRLRYQDGELVQAEFGESPAAPAVTGIANDEAVKESFRHSKVDQHDNGDVTHSTSDLSVSWNASAKKRAPSWERVDGEPMKSVGSGIGKYPRTKLSDEQQEIFSSEVEKWLSNRWLVKHNPKKHGDPKCVLPLLAAPQEHNPSNPVRPCLNYCLLNQKIKSHPGADAPACAETIRRWRQAGVVNQYELVDISKVYLQIYLSPELQKFQCVVWKGMLYVLERMGVACQ